MIARKLASLAVLGLALTGCHSDAREVPANTPAREARLATVTRAFDDGTVLVEFKKAQCEFTGRGYESVWRIRTFEIFATTLRSGVKRGDTVKIEKVCDTWYMTSGEISESKVPDSSRLDDQPDTVSPHAPECK